MVEVIPMRNVPAMFLAMAFAVGIPCAAKKSHAPLPPKLVAARTVYIENHGKAKLVDKAYAELEKWGRFQIVDASDKAEIVLVLSDSPGEHSTGRTATYDPGVKGGWKYGNVSSDSPGHTYLAIRDAKSGDVLYSDSRAGGSISKMIEELRKRIENQEKESK